MFQPTLSFVCVYCINLLLTYKACTFYIHIKFLFKLVLMVLSYGLLDSLHVWCRGAAWTHLDWMVQSGAEKKQVGNQLSSSRTNFLDLFYLFPWRPGKLMEGVQKERELHLSLCIFTQRLIMLRTCSWFHFSPWLGIPESVLVRRKKSVCYVKKRKFLKIPNFKGEENNSLESELNGMVIYREGIDCTIFSSLKCRQLWPNHCEVFITFCWI